MKSICFICGSLEPGKDGVGDYTRRLACELININHNIKIISVNDKFINKTTEESQQSSGISVSVLRIPEFLDWSEKINIVNNFLLKNKFDYISIQYVPYSFNRKGIAYGFNFFIKKLNFSGNYHIMFHELCLGVATNINLKSRFIAFLQFYLIKQLIKLTKKNKITTSNILYQNFLQERNINSKILTLFSNIPLVKKNYTKRTSENYVLGIFGTLYEFSRIADMLEEILLKNLNKKITLIGFGRLSNMLLWEQLSIKFNDRITFIYKGELSTEDISLQMAEIDLALSCTPLEYLGKSGAYAAWKLHKIDVMALPSCDFKDNLDKYYLEYQRMENLDSDMWNVSYVSRSFIKILEER